MLNSRYSTANVAEIAEYLDYIRTNDDSEGYTAKLLHKTMEKVQEVRSDEKMELSCMMWQLKYQDAVAEGRAEGTLAAIQNLMETLGLSIEKAMAALKIPENEREHYAELLAKQ